MKNILIRCGIAAAALALVLGPARPAESQKVKLSLGTAQAGGGNFEIGSAIAKVVTDNSGGQIEMDAAVSGGSTANIRTLQQKDKNQPFRLGMVTTPAIFWAQHAKKPFKEKQDILGLVSLYPQTVLYATRQDGGIKKWGDLAGKRLVGGPGGSIYVVTQNALRHSGLFDKTKREFLTNEQNVDALKDRRVDAGFFILNAGVAGPSYMELAQTQRGKLLFFGPDEETIKKLEKSDPGIVRDEVPAGTIPGQTQPVVTWAQMWALVVNSKMSNEVAYLVVKTMMDHHTQIERYHPTGKFIRPENALRGLTQFKMHPGAIRYWKEKGRI
jgi:hypothetical protein